MAGLSARVRLGHRAIIALTTAALALGMVITRSGPAEAALPVLSPGVWKTGSLPVKGNATYTFTPAKTAYYLLTLGDISADSVLRLTTTSGRQLASSDISGARAAETIIRKLSAGTTYRLQAATKGLGTATTFSIRALLLRPGVYYVATHRVAAYGPGVSANVAATLVNNTDSHIKLTFPGYFRFKSKSGTDLGTLFRYCYSDMVVRPHSLTGALLWQTPAGWYTYTPGTPTYQATPARPVTSGWNTNVYADPESPAGSAYWFELFNTNAPDLHARAIWAEYDRRGMLANLNTIDDTNSCGTYYTPLKQHYYAKHILRRDQTPVASVGKVVRKVSVSDG